MKKIIDRDGYIFAIMSFVVAGIGFFVSKFLGCFFILFGIFCLYFFRDPERHFVSDERFVLSPADGKILYIKQLDEIPAEFDSYISGPYTKISIFMNIFNVHVNRSPVSGVLERIKYIKGKFFNASLDKASEFNERNIFFVKSNFGEKIVFVQIAGLIARRIRTDVNELQSLERGERVGLIRFGSRVDVYLPSSYKILVEKGQTTVSAETIIAERNLG